MTGTNHRASLRVSATLLLLGQLLYIVVTQFHADGPANNHPVVFAEYAGSGIWTAVHLAQFISMAVLVAGLIALCFALDVRLGTATWSARFGAASAGVSLALYGVLQAVDGVANKQADVAWVSATGAEKTARFASAEAIRWIEWGVRSYQTIALGLALLLICVAVLRTSWLPRLIAYLIAISGLSYLMQGWVVGTEGFSQTESVLIVLSWVLSVAWMIWLAIVARQMPDSEPLSARSIP